GLVYARIKGLTESKGRTLVFVDDDNVLADDYLQELEILLKDHPGVAVWGPGVITPEYLAPAPAWIVSHFGGMYQQKHNESVCFGMEAGWPPYYPSGSGMAVQREVMEAYTEAVNNKKITAVG